MNPRLLPCLLLVASTVLAHAQPGDSSRRGDDRGRPDYREQDRGRPDYRENDRDRGRPRIILFEHADFRGDSYVLYPGDEIGNFAGGTFSGGRALNDRVSSIRIEGDAELLVYSDSRYRGHMMRVTESIRDLQARPTPDSRVSWNDRISSVQASRERRVARPVDADVMIRRAYEDILGRPVDPEGLRHYRGLVIDQGWSERMVRDHLRASAEYRGAGVDRLIKRAFEDLLGREPDANGLAHYRRMMIDRDWSEQELRDAIRSSDEYRRRSRGAGGR